jgi:drug/metabolite transporter (DMT)-like permease
VAIVFSVLCALVYGSSDFCGGLASRRAATLGVVVVSQIVGFVLLLAVLPLFGGTPTWNDIAWGAVCGIAGATAVGFLYRGLAIGTMSVVSPVTAVLAASVPVTFGVVVQHDHPSALAVGGIVAALVAVVCVSAAPAAAPAEASGARSRLTPGLLSACCAAAGFGTYFIALAQTRADAGMYPLLAARFFSLGLLAAGALLCGHARDLRIGRPALGLVAACGALDMAANVFYVLAAHSGMLSLVAVISSLYPASTVALAALVVGERLVPIQWAGVALALAGVAAISLGT